ncbi:MAG: tRNA(His) guanylyltransferase Thg1 family protein [Ruminococcus sp.]|nr:tRNA(His) guanylyltransferase Thg1 family protein [Ruminococcus sp.]
MPVHDELGCRMKEFYETIPKTKLMRRTPVAIRIDGKAFHTFTRGFAKPFDDILIKSMQETMQYLCEHIQGCVLGYTQSDEITLILVDYKKLTTNAWFDYEVQKMCSISASMATMAFNKFFVDNVREYDLNWKNGLTPQSVEIQQRHNDYMSVLRGAILKGAMFDARCFNIPKEEVTNLIYWRQLDASRNSIQMLGQAYFSHNELHNKTCSNIQDMLMEQKGINWNDLPVHKKRGSCCIRKPENTIGENEERAHWVIDNDIPIFKGEERDYIETLINFE